jgi:hypothetical protein
VAMQGVQKDFEFSATLHISAWSAKYPWVRKWSGTERVNYFSKNS